MTVARKKAAHAQRGKAELNPHDALVLLAAIKHEVFYPAADAVLAGEDKEMLAKAQVKHDGIQDLIEKAENTPADDPSFDATVTVLAEQARRLMKQEEEELFPRLRHSHLDLLGTGERMAARKTQLGTAPIDREQVRQARKVMGGR